MATDCYYWCEVLNHEKVQSIKTIVPSDLWVRHLMSCGLTSSGCKTRVLRRFSWALATNSIPFGPWLRKVWEALPQNINLARELWFVIFRESGGITRHTSRSSFTLCCETHWDRMSVPAVNPGPLCHYCGRTRISWIHRRLQAFMLHTITPKQALDSLSDLRAAGLLVSFLNILVKVRPCQT